MEFKPTNFSDYLARKSVNPDHLNYELMRGRCWLGLGATTLVGLVSLGIPHTAKLSPQNWARLGCYAAMMGSAVYAAYHASIMQELQAKREAVERAERENFGRAIGSAVEHQAMLDAQYHQAAVAAHFPPLPEPEPEQTFVPTAEPEVEALPPESNAIKFYDWNQAKDEAAGFIIAGNTGAAKSSVALWLLGLLTEDKPCQVVVFDIHAKKNNWHLYNLHIIHKHTEIISGLEAILEELKRRKETGDEEPRLIVVFDEIGATRINCENSKQEKWIEKALLLLGAEGRKFGICLIAINQSENVGDIGISAKNRNNYFLVLLNSAALAAAAPAGWGNNDPRFLHLEQTPYCCSVAGCVPKRVAKHPTHGDYSYFKMKGMKPQNLKSINALPPTVFASTNNNQNKQDWSDEEDEKDSTDKTSSPPSPPQSTNNLHRIHRPSDKDSTDSPPSPPVHHVTAQNTPNWVVELVEQWESGEVVDCGKGLFYGRTREDNLLLLREMKIRKWNKEKCIKSGWGITKSGTDERYKLASQAYEEMLRELGIN